MESEILMKNLLCLPGSLANNQRMLAFCLTHAIDTPFLNGSTSKGGPRDDGANSKSELVRALVETTNLNGEFWLERIGL